MSGHGLATPSGPVGDELARRSADEVYGDGAIRRLGDRLAFVFKAAREIGELGDNTARLRTAIRDDGLLRAALGSSDVQCVVLGHTRWASVGLITEPNAHPVDSTELGAGDAVPWVSAVLNGDVDNHTELRAADDLRIPPEITTDAKVIPTLVARRIAEGLELEEAFRRTVSRFEGSTAIAALGSGAPDRLELALRGSGQALYVGFAPDMFVVASEVYGLIEEASTYLRLDGESPTDPARPEVTRGQIVVLDRAGAGTPAGVERRSYDGTLLPLDDGDLRRAGITTRDVDRGEFRHFLVKEISEAPQSFRKTLRGRIAADGRLRTSLGPETLTEAVRDRMRSPSLRRVLVIGQGTAAVAGQSLASAVTDLLSGSLQAVALPATELSGFGLSDDMSDTLVVAISQSGSTTDTNRTVDLVRARGAVVVSIVNRRHSDLTDRSDGVLYTSDGRDVEMSVASTKAFYAQIAAGLLLAAALAEVRLGLDVAPTAGLLSSLGELAGAMERVLELRPTIAAAAQRTAPPRRSWAVVGNGWNRIAAQELRIKLSELCYKSIAVDATEDKKHIDLSAEPLVVVCAAGLSGSNADDVAKELAIYRAHRATPIVIATEGETRFDVAAVELIVVPPTDPRLAFVLAAMAGHLYGYEAALAIDASARPLREARVAVEAVAADRRVADDALFGDLAERLTTPAARFFDELRSGGYDGTLDAAVQVASLLRYATGLAPLDAYQLEYGKVGTPAVVIDDLTVALGGAIDELTRPIDAIRHQAKTVTVGISRGDESLLKVRLVGEVLGAGVARDALSYGTLRTLVHLDPAVDAVVGFTRYELEGVPASGDAQIHVVDRGGVALSLPSRTDDDPRLRGTKELVVSEREVTVARGRRDGRTVVLVPEVKDGRVAGLLLLHVRFHERLPAAVARTVLDGYRNRYGALRSTVTETEPAFDDSRLEQVAVVDLLTEPVYVLADRWRRR